MYHCRVQFYLTGRQCGAFEIFKAMPPLEGFSHEFLESTEPETALTQKADVIIANLQGTDAKHTLHSLLAAKKEDAEIILLSEPEQTDALADDFAAVRDIWTLPMSEKELRFRFLRYQQNLKQSKDLWQTEQFFETTINSTPTLVWYKDKDGIHEKVNDSFCRAVGKTKQQVQGQRHAYIWDVKEDDPACIESEWAVMTSRKTMVSEESVISGEGKRLLTTYKSPLYDVDGSVMGTVGIAIDVTQEREYEREITRKSHVLESLFTSMECGILCHSLDGERILSVNRAALNILGYESPEDIKENFHLVAESVMDEDKPIVKAAIQQLKNPGDSCNVEYRAQHEDGEILHILGNFKLILEDGELFFQRFLIDWTAHKQQAKREQLEREKQHAELVQALGIDFSLVCVFDLDTATGSALRISNCEKGILTSIFSGDLSLDECAREYINTCVLPEDRELMLQAFSVNGMRSELADKNIFYTNYRTSCVGCAGDIRYFQMKVVRVGESSGSFGVVVGFRSVDEETRSEMHQKELLQDALLQANRANKAKSTFLSNMSHDIRTPMNAIVGFTSLAINHIDKKDQVEEYLKKIMTSGNHLLSLINDILDMSRIESGKMHLDESECSLSDILHGLHSIIQADVRAKQLDLNIDAVGIINENIYCDKLRLNQVLLNLLSNAIKYTGSGGAIGFRITEKPASDGFATYEFLIKDTGIGMSEEFVARIFEPFERERTSTISGIQGTGLGMAITKNIVDMMNGTISVKSRQGAGTEVLVSFTFRLSVDKKESLLIPQLKDCRALVVDDDFNACDSVSYMLEQIGMRAEWTLSGKEAILRTRQAIRREDLYSVYIVDWLLPDINGVEVARRIRKIAGEDVPIIVVTSYDWSDIEDEAREAGITAFCSKPLLPSQLRRCLNSIVNPGEAELPADTSESISFHPGRILLAEDNELNQEIAEAILTEAGFTVDIAENGSIAVDTLSASEPGYYQVVLMDVQMPVMNGYEATSRIRDLENKDLASIPIIAMTANAFEEDKQEAFKYGMNAHIAKPIDIAALFDTLNSVLS